MKVRRFAVVLTVFALGCGASAKGLEGHINRTALNTDQATQHRASVEAGDAAWEKRADRAQLELAIQKWDEATKLKDNDQETYVKLAHGCYLLADGWLSFDVTDAATEATWLAMYERGFAYAERGLAAHSPDFEKRRFAGTKIEHAIKVVGRNGVPLLYWYATNLGKWAKEKGITTILEHKNRVFEIISRVWELGPDYFHGAADRYFGAYYSAIPTFAGRSAQKSHEHFSASLAKAPNYLGTYVLAAELYLPLEEAAAGKQPDPEKFDQYLEWVLTAEPCPAGSTAFMGKPCILPELAPEAAIEKRKAKKLKDNRDEFF